MKRNLNINCLLTLADRLEIRRRQRARTAPRYEAIRSFVGISLDDRSSRVIAYRGKKHGTRGNGRQKRVYDVEKQRTTITRSVKAEKSAWKKFNLCSRYPFWQ